MEEGEFRDMIILAESRVFMHEDLLKEISRRKDIHRNQLDKCISMLLSGIWKGGLVVKKLRSAGKKTTVYEARLNEKYRLIFTPLIERVVDVAGGYGNEKRYYFIWGIVHHDDVNRVVRRVVPGNITILDLPVEKIWEYKSEDSIDYPIGTHHIDVDSVIDKHGSLKGRKLFGEFGPQRWYQIDDETLNGILYGEISTRHGELWLTPEQEKVLATSPPVLLRGTSGTGKTLLSIYALRYTGVEPYHRKCVLYLTFNKYLSNLAKEIFSEITRSNKDSLNLPEVRFTTYHELLRYLVNKYGLQESFPDEKLVTFPVFRSIALRHPFGRTTSPELLWEEIRGVLKATLEEPVLSEKKYLSLGKRKAPLFTDRRKDVYQFLRYYQRYLLENGLYDDTDLTRALLSKVKPEFDALFIDEVQDFSELQLRLAFMLTKDPFLFITGDTQQAINLSNFRWEDLKRLIYEIWGIRAGSVISLNTNLRTGTGILDFAGALLEIKKKVSPVRYRYEGRYWSVEKGGFYSDMPYLIQGAEPSRIFRRIHGSPDHAIIVRNEESKRSLIDLLKKVRGGEYSEFQVFTIREVKGLEFDVVLVWNFIEPVKELWDRYLENKPVDTDVLWQEMRYFYVAVTRARKKLFLYDGSEPPDFYKIYELKSKILSISAEDLEIHWEGGAGVEEWLRKGEEYMRGGFYQHALQCFENAGNEEMVKLARAMLLQSEGNFREAGNLFEEIGDHYRAAQCYQKAGELLKASKLFRLAGDETQSLRAEARLLEKTGRYHEAGKKWQHAGEYRNALKCFLRVGNARGIYNTLIAMGKYDEAGEVAEIMGDLYLAESAYKKLGDEERLRWIQWKRYILEDKWEYALNIFKEFKTERDKQMAFITSCLHPEYLTPDSVIYSLYIKEFGTYGDFLYYLRMGEVDSAKRSIEGLNISEDMYRKHWTVLFDREAFLRSGTSLSDRIEKIFAENPIERAIYFECFGYWMKAARIWEALNRVIDFAFLLINWANRTKTPLGKSLITDSSVFKKLGPEVQAKALYNLGLPYKEKLAEAYVNALMYDKAREIFPEVSIPELDKKLSEVVNRALENE